MSRSSARVPGREAASDSGTAPGTKAASSGAAASARVAPDPAVTQRASHLVVGVVGAGTMGAGIAQAALAAGHDVLLHDADPAALPRARKRIAAGLTRLVDRGRLSVAERSAALAALRDAPNLEHLAAGADLVIEAALEDLALKRSIFRVLDMHSLPDVPLATNTSSLSVAAIAEATHHRERVLGLHFFNPAPVMPLVEVVAAEGTARAVIEAGMAFATGLGKMPVLCSDSPGFIVNRVNRAFTLEPLRMLAAGQVGIERIDLAIEAAGYPMGPFRLMDLVGIDVSLAVTRSLYEAFDAAGRFRPSPIQEAMAAAGRLGRKTGHGFYRYAEDGASEGEERPAGLPSGLADHAGPDGPAAHPLDAADIVERVELAIVNEAYCAVGDGVASPGDVDLALKLGAGHPMGPFERAGEMGLRHVVERLRRLTEKAGPGSGDQYEVARTLWQMATV